MLETFRKFNNTYFATALTTMLVVGMPGCVSEKETTEKVTNQGKTYKELLVPISAPKQYIEPLLPTALDTNSASEPVAENAPLSPLPETIVYSRSVEAHVTEKTRSRKQRDAVKQKYELNSQTSDAGAKERKYIAGNIALDATGERGHVETVQPSAAYPPTVEVEAVKTRIDDGRVLSLGEAVSEINAIPPAWTTIKKGD